MTDPTEAGGTGQALDANISVGELEAALAAARERDEAALPARHLASLEAKRERYRGFIADLDGQIAAAKKGAE